MAVIDRVRMTVIDLGRIYVKGLVRFMKKEFGGLIGNAGVW